MPITRFNNKRKTIKNVMMSKQDRCYGAFFGSIVGDALGGPVEFKVRGTYETVQDMQYNWNLICESQQTMIHNLQLPAILFLIII